MTIQQINTEVGAINNRYSQDKERTKRIEKRISTALVLIWLIYIVYTKLWQIIVNLLNQ